MHHIRGGQPRPWRDQCGQCVAPLRDTSQSRVTLVTAGHRAVTATCDQQRSTAVHWTRKCDMVTTSTLQAGKSWNMECNSYYIYYIRRKMIKSMGEVNSEYVYTQTLKDKMN